MCTLTWFGQDGGYQIFFNRDERRSRRPGLPPAVRRRGETRFIAPLDGDHGGTWIAVSQRGLCFCLLNGFISPGAPPPIQPGDFTSRGFLALSLIESINRADALNRLGAIELNQFRPFMLALFEPLGSNTLACWTGTAFEIDEHALEDQPLVSSSFYTEEVRASRASVLRQLLAHSSGDDLAEAHLDYHRSHEPARGPFSPCMHREDARTVSFSRVEVDRDTVRFSYAADSPCRGRPGTPVLLLGRG